MDPASAIGIAASSLSLLAALGRSVISVKNMIDGIRNVNEASGHLAAELDTFQFSLSIFEHQVRTGAIRNHVAGWWDSQSLEALLTNATQTFSRLDFIYRAIRRDRSFLDRTREYLRTTMYDQEINHLKLRINTYISAFNIPVLMNM
ncbi:uncharacterized protein F4822DRAFT_258510 [Hypoxylon trugodes]|uniref:uncharacterized protein n=1 Tax=Hypoxylon trugodes TaxID=326681 RepID=UPI0021A0B5E6|nr:uncharacterized protein F4822DRAFT_258510 [Hypoxylon trugodes]KAI1388801.1 hypothetical protein F4822DRAFT_258510 [Hypoxylon trugodes]